MITQEQINELFEYRDGDLIWKSSPSNSVKKGSIAGSVCKRGYVSIKINRKLYKAHRLIFMLHHGYFPEEVDHIDTIKSNNRTDNLRAANSEKNQHNRPIQKNNTSGIKGVCRHGGKWAAAITYKYKRYYLGLFVDIFDAEKAVKSKRLELHKEFANNG